MDQAVADVMEADGGIHGDNERAGRQREDREIEDLPEIEPRFHGPLQKHGQRREEQGLDKARGGNPDPREQVEKGRHVQRGAAERLQVLAVELALRQLAQGNRHRLRVGKPEGQLLRAHEQPGGKLRQRFLQPAFEIQNDGEGIGVGVVWLGQRGDSPTLGDMEGGDLPHRLVQRPRIIGAEPARGLQHERDGQQRGEGHPIAHGGTDRQREKRGVGPEPAAGAPKITEEIHRE